MTKSKDAKLLITKLQFLVNKLNRFKDFLNSIDVTVSGELELEQLQLRVKQSELLANEYAELTAQATSLTVTLDDLPSCEEFEEQYFLVIAQASLFLRNKGTSGLQSPSNSLSHLVTPPASCNVKLPMLNIPTFSGHYTEWASFHETFTALIDNNSNLSDVEKFYYLQNSLKGSAKELTQDLTATAANYKIALRMLSDRFNNEKLIIFSHLESIFDQVKLTKESAPELRKFQDNLTRHLRALDNYQLSDDKFKAAVLAYTIKSKVDANTAVSYSKFKLKQIPSIDESLSFLSSRCEILEDISPCSSKNHSQNTKASTTSNTKNYKHLPRPNNTHSIKQSLTVTNNYICALCKGGHLLYSCPTFLSLSPQGRLEKANELNICNNCLKHSSNSKCNSKHKCKTCQRSHNSLLCFSNSNSNSISRNSQNESPISGSREATISDTSPPSEQIVLSCTNFNQVLLSTAVIKVLTNKNRWVNARCLLDSASQVSFITSKLCDKLGYEPVQINTSVVGINGNTSLLNKAVQIKVSSLQNAFHTSLSCVVIPKITQNLPIRSFDKFTINIPPNIKLADTDYHKSSPIDILIGATHFYSLLCIGQFSMGKNMPTLQKTLLGWVISGNLGKQNVKPSVSTCNAALTNVVHEQQSNLSNETLHNSLTRFWQIESIQPKNSLSLLSSEEQFCERHFSETVAQDQNGTLVVSIPFNSKLALLRDSKQRAQDRFYRLERKFAKNPSFHREYAKFMREYIQLGHATKITNDTSVSSHTAAYTVTTLDGEISINNIPSFFLPHHAVLKSNSLTTKLRVVFDGSAKSDSNISINDTQIVGPVLQDDLFSILLRFRQGKIALTGDCEKMYRMINVQPCLRKFQCILWRENSEQPIETYQLNTITYGTASASYLATKCLEYLANQNIYQYPRASEVIKTSFYMDDLLFTADTVNEVLQVKREIAEILSTANIPIRKFLSNCPAVMEQTNEASTQFFTVPLGERSNAKALGLSWNSVSDYIYYNVQLHDHGPSITKRSILSATSQLFDPLGLLSPITITAKIMIQKLWELKLSWDESVPSCIQSQWVKFRLQLQNVNSLQIPRCVTLNPKCTVQLHGFSDSSSVAYGACIYIRCTNSSNQVSTHLLCAKSRVTPLHTVTIPRLELCAALLLSQLMHKVKNALTIECHSIFLWSDSTIVLTWIQSAPNKYKTFIANRIATIQELFPADCWRHVRSQENPADLISRGITAAEILSNSAWWFGPHFLSATNEFWKNTNVTTGVTEISELRVTSLIATRTEKPRDMLELYKRFSSFIKLQRVVAYILRFITNCREPLHARHFGVLSVEELQQSLTKLIEICQGSCFPQEILCLKSKRQLKSDSNILSLHPFLDENQLLRVGGRLSNSQFNYDKKYPLLLPKNHPLTTLIMKHYHYNLLHCGVQQLLACMRERYWPISGKSSAKKLTRQCLKCFRANPTYINPLMGDLPSKRVAMGTPVFHNTGLDYAGPMFLKEKKGRASKLMKAYICIFICLVTRAIHLETVTDLSTDAFIAVLKRFVSRRGKPRTLSSDNAKNFIGAKNQLREMYHLLQVSKDQISNYLIQEGIKWEFIIPHAPHQGGIWESGIKSTKYHLKRVLGNTNLTYEDFTTVLNQIECVLNSRPLSCLSADPSDFNPLTPGHFLIGRSLCALPEPNYLHINENRLSLYQRSQKLTQHFWNRWSKEVVPQLQRRTKWFKSLPNLLQVGTLVLIREENLPPLNWSLGRVKEIHQAADGVVRSCAVALPSGSIIKRSVNKLCVLPM